MNGQQLVNDIKARLYARADMNRDGKVDRKDIEAVAAAVAAQAEAQTKSNPLPALAVAFATGAVLCFGVMRLVGC